MSRLSDSDLVPKATINSAYINNAYIRQQVPSVPRLLTVIKKSLIGTGLIRVTLGGSQLQGFPERSEASHIKLFIPRSHQAEPAMPTLTSKGVRWPSAEEKPIVRTYTVRAFRSAQQELDVEFVNHSLNSPASGWAHSAKVGSVVGVAGPGGPNPILPPATWNILAGDLSALPAIAALLECGAPGERSRVFIEIDHCDQEIPLACSKESEINWVVREPGKQTLLQAIQGCQIPDEESVSGFIAGESRFVVTARDYLVSRYGFSKKNLYAVPYWRRGDDEESYHQDRHRIMDEVY